MSKFTTQEIQDWFNAFRYDGTGRGMAACQAFRELAESRTTIADRDAEIERLKAQRDALANDIHREYNMRHARETLSPTPELSANYADWMLKEAHSLRIVGGQVEEVK